MIVKVTYHDWTVGALSDEARDGHIYFEYDRSFLNSGLELSPLALPLAAGLFHHAEPAFERLHGLFYDSLPDKWGRQVLKARLAKVGMDEESLGPLERLSYVGSRGMGALCYAPDHSTVDQVIMEALNLIDIQRSACEILEGHYQNILPALLESGASAGGARPKMLIGISQNEPEQIIARTQQLPEGYDGWLLKIETNPEREYGKAEYAYWLMARAAGIQVPDARLIHQIDSQGREVAHFAVKRFDREGAKRIHVHSMAGLLHHDFNVYGSDYRDLFRLVDATAKDHSVYLELLRRVAFNFAAGVRDDHAKNHAYVMLEDGTWKLSPAYDLAPSKGRALAGEYRHELSLAGKATEVVRKDLIQFAGEFDIPKAKTTAILDQVADVCSRWPEFAKDAGVTPARIAELEKGFEPYDIHSVGGKDDGRSRRDKTVSVALPHSSSHPRPSLKSILSADIKSTFSSKTSKRKGSEES